MRIEITTDAAEFRSRAAEFFRRDPLRHTVITTSVANHLAGGGADVGQSRFLSVHAADAGMVGAAMRVAGRGVYLGALPPGTVAAVADAMAEDIAGVDGVEGAIADAAGFAEHWSQRQGLGYRELYSTRLYRLGTLRFPEAAGSPRRATESDTGLCVEWLAAMRSETGVPSSSLDAVAIRNHIATGRWWLWEHSGRPVSLVAHQVPAFGWSRVGPVYTPPFERGHGYAGVLTAHVGRTVRLTGLNVCLFADLSNPTANKIYHAIGFEPVRDFRHYRFDVDKPAVAV